MTTTRKYSLLLMMAAALLLAGCRVTVPRQDAARFSSAMTGTRQGRFIVGKGIHFTVRGFHTAQKLSSHIL